MREEDGQNQNGIESKLESDRGRRRLSPGPELRLPKNRSTGNLLSHVQTTEGRGRIRFSFDAGSVAADFDTMSRSPIMTEHEHGLGVSGLRRIRQQPPRAPTIPSSGASSRSHSVGPRSSSMTTLTLSNSHAGSMILPSGPSSPTSTNFTEDLSRFPSESLHSFSFAHQSEEFLHNRQNVLKRSVEFMSQKLGWGANAGIASAQARVTGDQEMQGMLELLARAKLVGANNISGLGHSHLTGPLTGPASAEDGHNIFDSSFVPVPRSESPDDLFGSPRSSPVLMRSPHPPFPTVNEESLDTSEGVKRDISKARDDSEPSSRTPTNESHTTIKTTPPPTRRQSLKRTFTDVAPLTLQNKLMEALSQPFQAGDNLYENLLSPMVPQSAGAFASTPHPLGPAVHGHSSRWAPAAQAIFTTESVAPFTILAANDLACLVFGVTNAEVRKMGILEVVREERRAWLVEKLSAPGSSGSSDQGKPPPSSPSGSRSQQPSPTASSSFLLGRSTGVTASLLSRPNSRQSQKNTPPRRAQTDDGAGSSIAKARTGKGELHHPSNKSRGVLLCGDVVPIQKRNGATGSASLWVKEKKAGLIWVLEEIHEDVAILSLNGDAQVTKLSGPTDSIWGENGAKIGMDIGKLVPRIPRQGIDSRSGELDYAEIVKRKYFTARQSGHTNIPCMVERIPNGTDLRVSSFPHIAGIMVLSQNLQITSSNSVFSAALFGQEKPDGRPITELIPDFDRILKILTEEDGVRLVDGLVIPDHSFRRARAFLALRDGKPDAAAYFLKPDGLPAKHRDGSEIRIDCQLRVVNSEPSPPPAYDENVIEERSDEEDVAHGSHKSAELVYALWITYSRHIHANKHNLGIASPQASGAQTPLHQPSPGQTERATPMEIDSDGELKRDKSHASMLTAQLKAAAKKTAAVLSGRLLSIDGSTQSPSPGEKKEVPRIVEPEAKKSIDDFVILEEMGQGAYGQVKLARYKKNGNKVVLKYVTKRRILVDTWTRDRRLGTVPLEIHVLDYLRRDGLKHDNIVEMADFFEDSVNYYIEMVPHGLPGMDLFDYIELRVNMDENECRSIFVQVAQAIHHLHTKAGVVHRDIKDENVVLDGEGNIKLIDFGSAAYIKNGPFDVFVGTIDYAAPEVLAGKSYCGKEQDVWALGILLYTIVYKENPFYSIDEIMDRDLRVPHVMSEDSIDLIRRMLDRNVDTRITIEEVVSHPWCLDSGDD